MTDVIMPQMGESIAEGTITKWLKQVGDKVQRDEPLFEISTDKVDAEIPAPAAGVLKEIRVEPLQRPLRRQHRPPRRLQPLLRLQLRSRTARRVRRHPRRHPSTHPGRPLPLPRKRPRTSQDPR
jgi:hypothetical protein